VSFDRNRIAFVHKVRVGEQVSIFDHVNQRELAAAWKQWLACNVTAEGRAAVGVAYVSDTATQRSLKLDYLHVRLECLYGVTAQYAAGREERALVEAIAREAEALREPAHAFLLLYCAASEEQR